MGSGFGTAKAGCPLCLQMARGNGMGQAGSQPKPCPHVSRGVEEFGGFRGCGPVWRGSCPSLRLAFCLSWPGSALRSDSRLHNRKDSRLLKPHPLRRLRSQPRSRLLPQPRSQVRPRDHHLRRLHHRRMPLRQRPLLLRQHPRLPRRHLQVHAVLRRILGVTTSAVEASSIARPAISVRTSTAYRAFGKVRWVMWMNATTGLTATLVAAKARAHTTAAR